MHCELYKVVLNKENRPAAQFPLYNGFSLIECYDTALSSIDEIEGNEALLIEVLGDNTIERIQPSCIKTLEDLKYAKSYITEQLKSYPIIRVATIDTLYVSGITFHVQAFESSDKVDIKKYTSEIKYYGLKHLEEDGYTVDNFDNMWVSISEYIGNSLEVRHFQIEAKDLKLISNVEDDKYESCTTFNK